MNVGEPLNELEAEQMMEADKDGDGSFDYEGKSRLVSFDFILLDKVEQITFLPLKAEHFLPRIWEHDDWRLLQDELSESKKANMNRQHYIGQG